MIEFLKFVQLTNAIYLLYLGIKGLVTPEYKLSEWHMPAVVVHLVICWVFLLIL